MDIEDDDDFYAPEEPQVPTEQKPPVANDLESGEEEDEGAAMDEDSDDDSDIDIITERKDGTKAAPPTQSKYSDIRNIPQRSAVSNDTSAPTGPSKKDKAQGAANIGTPSADQTSKSASKSTIDIDADPIYPAAGKPITQVNIDEDLPENEKPWRKPGTDISDYFNFGFDEFTWALYAAKQDSVRGEFGADAFAANNKKMMEEFNNMMMMGGMQGMGNNPGAGPGMPGMEGMPPEMQAMMQQMMAQGIDPSQMDPAQLNAMMGGNQAQMQGQNFGQAYGGNQGYYDQNMQQAGRGGFGGRGRRGRW